MSKFVDPEDLGYAALLRFTIFVFDCVCHLLHSLVKN